ncbi:IS5/IS1182 family transposase, partial [Klebsiella pneumoniae]
MLRIHGLKRFYNLSDVALEDPLHELAARLLSARFALDSALPDGPTIRNFRAQRAQYDLR